MSGGAWKVAYADFVTAMMALFLSAFVTLFVVIDPLGLIPLFIALTQGMAPEHRRAVGLRALSLIHI